VSGPLLLALPVALLAGAVSFASPCVLPLVPGYLSYATGLSGADLEDAKRGRMVLGSFLFVLGFSAVFVVYGGVFGSLGAWLVTYQRQISIVLGVFTIVVGLAFFGAIPWLQRDVRIHRVPAVGLAAAPMLGVLFAIGWTPCVGPTLSAVQALARMVRWTLSVTSARASRISLPMRSDKLLSRSTSVRLKTVFRSSCAIEPTPYLVAALIPVPVPLEVRIGAAGLASLLRRLKGAGSGLEKAKQEKSAGRRHAEHQSRLAPRVLRRIGVQLIDRLVANGGGKLVSAGRDPLGPLG